MTKRPKTPIRASLLTDSKLHDDVQDGIGAVESGHRKYLDLAVRTSFADSLDLDEATRSEHPGDHRWDYLLGHTNSGEVIGLEPHSANQGEVTTVIKKRSAALEQLRPHLRQGRRITRWLWVASGEVQFLKLEKARLALAQNGVTFVGKRVQPQHLPGGAVDVKGRRR